MRALIAAVVAAIVSVGAAGAQRGNTGAIKGVVRVSGKVPGNPVIRMGVDPMCAKINAGKRVVDDMVVATADGLLANAFAKLDGSFPPSAAPAEPVVIDQRGCIYGPRVVGARVGQVLRIKNSDSLLHNVHTNTTKGNSFNVGQPQAGIQYDFRLKDEEMLQLKCDVHRWMSAWVGVVTHRYFAVSGADGSFTISGVPA